MRRVARVVALALATAVVSAGCGFQGLQNIPLPGNEGTGDGSYDVDVVMSDVTNIVPNTPVRLDDLNVGSTRAIHLEGYNAVVTVAVPENSTIRVAQTSLLGAKHLELGPPPDGQAPQGRLKGGDRIPLDRSGNYPDTEQVLATVAMFLNGGGLQQIRTITTELNKALNGRQQDVRAALTNLATFTDGLNRQRADITRAITNLNRLSATVAKQKSVVENALEVAPPALDVVNSQRAQLTETLQSLARFGDVADRVITKSRADLVGNLQDLQAPLRALADSGDSLTKSLYLAGTVIFPVRAIPRLFQGDYANLFVTVDATLPSVDKAFLGGTPLAGVLSGVQGALGGLPAGQAANPLAKLVPGQRGGN
jgi:phospholipid/cholesterol/gamma-HCH transport system substrate-binding protein